MKPMTRERYRMLWVVEIANGVRRDASWSSTVGVALTRRDAFQQMLIWKRGNPNDKFRVQKYVATT